MGARVIYTKASLLIILAFSALLITIGTAIWGIVPAVLTLLLLVLSPIIFQSVRSFEFGFIILFTYSYFLFYIGRLIAVPGFKPGVGFELLILILVVGLMVQNKFSQWHLYKNRVTIIIVVNVIYGILQIANPSSLSITPWLFYLRFLIFNALLYFTCSSIFNNYKLTRKFAILFFGFGVVSALYGIYQEIFGYTNFEWANIHKNEGLLELIQLGPLLRKFSIFSDVTTFGILMAITIIFSVVIGLSKVSPKTRVVSFLGALIMMIGMSYSGTRTATAMVPIGLAMYGLLTINRISTLIFGMIITLVLLVFLFGPFYGTMALRMRSTFFPNQDASMNVRDINRERIRPYLLSHPFGGGVNTTGAPGEQLSPGHYLAGFPPDSGYLKTALEQGWIGLIIELLLYFTVLQYGIRNFFRAQSEKLKAILAGLISAFFALCVANFTQEAMNQKPIVLIVFVIFAILTNAQHFDKPEDEKDL